MVNYRKRFVEVSEILSHMSETDVMKIPQNIRDTIAKAKDPKYVWKYDQTKSLSEQGLCRDTIAILSYLNTEFMLDEEQRELMRQIHEFNEKKYRESLKKTKANNIPINPESDVLIDSEDFDITKVDDETTSLTVQTTEVSLFKKFINKVKSIFTKK